MSSEEFAPKPKGRPKGSKNKPKTEVVIEKTASVGITGTPGLSLPSEEKPDKHALARAVRKDNEARMAMAGALEGQQLIAPPRPGFVRRWVNDEKGKLDRRMNKGYTFVEEGEVNAPFEATSHGLGSQVRQRVGRGPDGQPMDAVLMEIEEDLYQEDQQKKEDAITKTAAADLQGSSLGSRGYTPKESDSHYELPHERGKR